MKIFPEVLALEVGIDAGKRTWHTWLPYGPEKRQGELN